MHKHTHKHVKYTNLGKSILKIPPKSISCKKIHTDKHLHMHKHTDKLVKCTNMGKKKPQNTPQAFPAKKYTLTNTLAYV